jgi:hypothetical protein
LYIYFLKKNFNNNNYYNSNRCYLRYKLGIGDWGLGIGDWGLGPIPNPQSPIPNPHQRDEKINYYLNKK